MPTYFMVVDDKPIECYFVDNADITAYDTNRWIQFKQGSTAYSDLYSLFFDPYYKYVKISNLI
jgi:hypothetical protein